MFAKLLSWYLMIFDMLEQAEASFFHNLNIQNWKFVNHTYWFLNKFEIRSIMMIFFFRISLTDEHDSCVSYWILFFYNAAHSSLAMPTKFFFLWKKTVQNFCLATFKNVETFITHCPPICSKFAMLLSLFRNKRFVLNKMFQWNGSKSDVFYVL